MMRLRVGLALLIALATGSAFAQSWAASYETGLQAARALHWAEARQAFLQAAASRPDDVSGPTRFPGPITEQHVWRNGSPYSPNFLAAYSAYRSGLEAKDPQTQTALFHTAEEELQTLLNKKQSSAATLYVLNALYTRLGESEKARTSLEAASKDGGKLGWKVDTEIVDPQEIGQIQALSESLTPAPTAPENPATTSKPGKSPGSNPVPTKGSEPTYQAGKQPEVGTPAPATAFLGPVAQNPTKFALLIGNSQGRATGAQLPFAADDAQALRQALVNNAGYLEANVDLVLNATSDQIMASAKALSDRVNEGATVFIFFAGAGSNIDGKDFLAGIETERFDTPAGQIAKNDLYRLFMVKGAHIFAFYETNRPIKEGRFFGMETPLVGSIAQSQATLPGDTVNAIVRNGKDVGIYVDAFNNVLAELRSNWIPISEFGWQLFYRIRRGDSGTTGGGSRQTPTLPVLTNMGADARF